jgi:YidC/Oxa1 family membrane protein insertase
MINLLKTVIYYPLYNLLIFLAWIVPGHSLGWAIIMLTIIIRVILLPPSIKAARAQVRLQMLQPEMNRIRKEIKDQQEQGKALMELYKKEGVSPFGSCLPLLIQLPIIFILYRVFYNINRYGLNTENLYPFTPHLDSVNTFFYGLDLAKPELWVLPILAGALQYVLSKMMMPPTPKPAGESKKNGAPDMADTMAMANKQMVYIFPLITIFIARSLPAGIALYWITTTLFGIVQQIYVNKTIKGNAEEKKEAIADAKEIEAEHGIVDKEEDKNDNAPKKSDLITKMMRKKLDKQEKKTGVEVTIRKKK